MQTSRPLRRCWILSNKMLLAGILLLVEYFNALNISTTALLSFVLPCRTTELSIVLRRSFREPSSCTTRSWRALLLSQFESCRLCKSSMPGGEDPNYGSQTPSCSGIVRSDKDVVWFSFFFFF